MEEFKLSANQPSFLPQTPSQMHIMPTCYTIQIQNQSGNQQRYLMFSQPPSVTGGRVQGQVWPTVFADQSTPPGAQAILSVSSLYYGVVGRSQGVPGSDVMVYLSQKLPVILGQTTLVSKIMDGKPSFDGPPQPNGGSQGAFQVRTGNNFTVEKARQSNYLVGLGMSEENGYSGPAAVFIPEPNTSYQIQPSNTLVLTTGSQAKGSMIDSSRLGGSKISINLTPGKSNFVIVHDSDGSFNVQDS